MKSYSEAMYWKTNRKWYVANYEKDCFELTEMAPPRAIDSFKLYLKENKKCRKTNNGTADTVKHSIRQEGQ